ncbi:MAG: dihydroorotate dehydrogenase [Candidatus Omnitrophica bacterium]|nr:dihydroorotate dehydrogenase [Candidatus Omnitrophota bacterium]
MPNLSVKVGKLKLRNPVMVSSGTFGYAEEFKDFIDLRKLGAIVSKTVTVSPRRGNPSPRTCEAPAGMLNSIGLENPGIDAFIEKKLPVLAKAGPPVIVSISSIDDPDEFVLLARKLDKIKAVAAVELNISCPNIKHTQHTTQNSQLISQDPRATYNLVKKVRKATQKTLITKLTPNVTDICEIALAAEGAGSDALALINTLTGMSIDVDARRPRIAAVTAGLSGPAIRPVALRMVWEAYQKVNIPIIGMGGIIDTASALEFFLAGASAVSIGTANFINPGASVEIIDGIKRYLIRDKLKGVKNLTGGLKI